MNMMLLAMFAAVGLGMFAKDFGRRESLIALGIAIALVVIYFIRPWYMT